MWRAWRGDGAAPADAATEAIGCRRVRTIRCTKWGASARPTRRMSRGLGRSLPASSTAVRSRCAAANSSSPPMPVNIDPPAGFQQRQVNVDVEWPHEAMAPQHALRIRTEKVKLVRMLEPHPLGQTQVANDVLLPVVLVAVSGLGKDSW